MILWVLILSLFGACVALFGRQSSRKPQGPRPCRAGSHRRQLPDFHPCRLQSVSAPQLAPPVEGDGLNPVLQDPALAIHPPFLYAGYVGLSIAFSFACAALIEGRIDAAWARWVRPWTLVAWMFLTGGIALGSWWAYYELGWGGFWFWDPVENASLMPWLAATALLHSSIVVEKRNALKIWTVLLSILLLPLAHRHLPRPLRRAHLRPCFCRRSGPRDIHPGDPLRPHRRFASLYAWRAPKIEPGGLFAPISREGALVLNNLLLACAASCVFVGTLYPLALEVLTGAKISVGPPFYNLTFVPIVTPLLLLVPIGPVLSWKRAERWAPSSACGSQPLSASPVALPSAVFTGRPVLGPHHSAWRSAPG